MSCQEAGFHRGLWVEVGRRLETLPIKEVAVVLETVFVVTGMARRLLIHVVRDI